MRKLVAEVLAICILCTNTWAGMALSLGYGGNSEAFSIGFDVGQKEIAVGLALAFTDEVEEDIIDTPCPHRDYTLEEHVKHNPEGILFLKLSPLLRPLNPSLIIGFSFQFFVDIAMSNVTGWSWREYVELETYPEIGISLAYRKKEAEVGPFVGYTLRRGLILGIAGGW